jgi:predicted Zn-ribbon and HTH transcriptional regulator
MRIVFSMLLVLSVLTSYSQARRIRKAEAQQQGPTSLDPLPQEQQNIPKHARKRTETKGATYNSEKEYYDRVEAFAKTRRKNEKMLMTPQYSDPSYFGHKRPPKKRPPSKMKFCKECGIRH